MSHLIVTATGDFSSDYAYKEVGSASFSANSKILLKSSAHAVLDSWTSDP